MIAILNKGVLSTSLYPVQIRYGQIRQDATSISASNLDMTERQKAVSTQKFKHTLSAHFKQLLTFLLLLLLLFFIPHTKSQDYYYFFFSKIGGYS